MTKYQSKGQNNQNPNPPVNPTPSQPPQQPPSRPNEAEPLPRDPDEGGRFSEPPSPDIAEF
ncbi:hypothetical protein [Aphanizomenon flos-aquae]|uniref:hypothetical protein n=1 Tax=Aphanizomenon flos-aquae TaxID=1176 RepID=UPI0004897E74|nr:hypothetical protein [Aphanizomenon flos-aquae]